MIARLKDMEFVITKIRVKILRFGKETKSWKTRKELWKNIPTMTIGTLPKSSFRGWESQ